MSGTTTTRKPMPIPQHNAPNGLRLVGGRKRLPKAVTATSDAAVTDTPEARLRALNAGLVARARAESTRNAYASDWAHFVAWCQARGVPALPAESEAVALYLTAHMETLKPATLSRRLVAISQTHQDAGHEPPTRAVLVRKTFAGIKRDVGVAQNQKTALMVDDLRRMAELQPDSLLGVRDRALLLLGFAGAFRISEVTGLNVSDIAFSKEGLTIAIRKSKTDQEARGQRVAIPTGKHPATCPVAAYRAWVEQSGIKSGPVFRKVTRFGTVMAGRLSDDGATLVIKRAAVSAGLDPALYAGHSLRAGLATSAAKEGVPDRKIMAQTRHKSRAMVDRYIRDAELFRDNAAGSIGL